jgi:hypothetical protein
MGQRNDKKAARFEANALAEMDTLASFLFSVLFLRGFQFGPFFRKQLFDSFPFFYIGLDREKVAVVVYVQAGDKLAHPLSPIG